MKADTVLKDRALLVRHNAAMKIVETVPSPEERWNLLLGVVAPSPALVDASEREAREELAYWSDRRTRRQRQTVVPA